MRRQTVALGIAAVAATGTLLSGAVAVWNDQESQPRPVTGVQFGDGLRIDGDIIIEQSTGCTILHDDDSNAQFPPRVQGG